MHAKHPTIAKRWEKEERVAGYGKPARKTTSSPKAKMAAGKSKAKKMAVAKGFAAKKKGK